ncbi:MAG: diphthine--ammonia ligase [Theionarchaea archaeon]|nr:diphthine--ammonia ligase [Theionarchaea archaeon]
MRLGVLFSGGKDSTLALYRAREREETVCLITIISENRFSYMFHTPNISITSLQAQSMGLPLITQHSRGEKETELEDLRNAFGEAIKRYEIEGIVTGAIESVYQATRIQVLCHELDLWCFNPLWLSDQKALLHEIIANKFEVIISGVYAYPLTENWLGRRIDRRTITELLRLQEKYAISPSGEGGEIETTVLDAPFFTKKIQIVDFTRECDKNTGIFSIKDAYLVDK